MTLDEFITLLDNRVTGFKKEWNSMHEEDPEEFPLEMSQENWNNYFEDWT